MVVLVGLGRERAVRPEKQAENKQIEGERREKQAEREREARTAGGKLSMSRRVETVTDRGRNSGEKQKENGSEKRRVVK